MSKLLHTFLDRLTERIVTLVATVVSSTFESFRAKRQAEQQGMLEALARQYEQDGQSQIAQTLRQRAERLVTDNPASDAEAVLGNTIRHSGELTPIAQTQPNGSKPSALAKLPRSRAKPRRRRKTEPEPTDMFIDSLPHCQED